MKNLLRSNVLWRKQVGTRLLPGLAAVLLLGGTNAARASLEAYDAAIAADAGGGLTPVATLTSAVSLTGTAGSAFDFGTSSGDATIEFILEGDPSFNNSAFLAVGATTASSLRYELWDNTGQLGFTQSGVADYSFAPAVPSPSKPTHIAYVWDPTATTMKVYVNGQLAGTASGVAAAFVIPSGQGWLGSAANGNEPMKGTIHRVTVYDTVLSEDVITRHANAYGGVVEQALGAYDAAIAADVTGGLAPVSTLTNAVTLVGAEGAPFDFGFSSDDVTMEFILEGDPSTNNSSYLAVGENTGSNLRYELWDNTGQLGFTQIGVADYPFSPGVSSPTQPTHITYVWNATTYTMKLYRNGLLAGTTVNVDPNFSMPTGIGYLGANPSATEPMVGTIYRVTTYDDILSDEAILRHAKAFTDVLQPPIIVSFTASTNSISAGGSVTLAWDVQNARTLSINGTDRTGTTNLTVAPLVTTTYTLTAVNTFGNASDKVTVVVNPKLDSYDAAITADASGGLIPVARQTNAVVLSGAAGVPFDFGATSGDVTIEFIMEGDTSVGSSAYLAVGEIATSSLRYELWENTGQLGFTQSAVADYSFSPVVPSPSWPTHVTYAWDSVNYIMRLYVNGVLAGTTTDVDTAFVMPSGQGWLGSTATGGELMKGTLFRITVYNGNLAADVVLRHANAFMSVARPGLHAYDNAITSGVTNGLPTLARLLAPVTFTGAGGVGFYFGQGSGDMTMEFIVEGDPSTSMSSSLAVGTNSSSLIRYEVWGSADELGFTQAGVADYLFTPSLAAPTQPTHVTYVWNSTALVMKAYINGVLGGTTTNVDTSFSMPVDLGRLGANLDDSEPMTGTMHRVTVYDQALTEDVILNHAKAFLNVTTLPVVSLAVSGSTVTVTLSQGTSGLHYRLEYRDSLASTDTWQLLQDIPALSGTSISVADPSPLSAHSARFYRAVQLP